jgi:hypothetical protein
MRIDRVRDLIEVTPLLAKFRGFMSRLLLFATLPLYAIHDTASVEAAMLTDGDETGLPRHEAGPPNRARPGTWGRGSPLCTHRSREAHAS